MENVQKRYEELNAAIKKALERLHIAKLQQELAELTEQTQASDFWNNPTKAQETAKRQAKLDSKVQPWTTLQKDLEDSYELIAMGDDSLAKELGRQLTDVETRFNELKEQLKFAGPFDDHDVIVSIFAGAGGTDAQDWAEMLLRMYLRWAEQQKYQTKIIEQSSGDEAGLKSVTLEIEGQNIYGQLKGEHGVHRLVRLSPFNSDNLRQTSFAKVDVLPKIDRPQDLEIDDKDLKVDVYRSGGHGGQSVNTTDSAVRITHLPTGLVVAIQNERSQLQNKETAMTILRSRLAQLQLEQHQERIEGLKGPNQSAEWGNQIRSYVLHPYKMVKDLRTNYETSDTDKVLDGDLNDFITAYLENY